MSCKRIRSRALQSELDVSVAMPVMGITHVGVGMLQVPVKMLMGMPERLIVGLAGHLLSRVRVVVMGVVCPRAVAMAMGMEQHLMAMPVAVLFVE